MGDVERIIMLLDNDGSDGMEPLSLPETSGKTDKVEGRSMISSYPIDR